jgi:hypothetical protein
LEQAALKSGERAAFKSRLASPPAEDRIVDIPLLQAATSPAAAYNNMAGCSPLARFRRCRAS